MQAIGMQPEKNVTGAYACGQCLAALHGTDGETGEIEVRRAIHAWHLRGLAADQGTSAGSASGGDSIDDTLRDLHVKRSHSKIIQEEQRLGTPTDQIVNAHGDKINADCVDSTGIDGDTKLGADTVGGGDANRIRLARRFEVK